jgi:Fe-S cluster biosynthesis and repair protein YggX
MDIAQRIAQFENMVQADPTNDMAHFSLGGAYAQAGRHAEAAKSYMRCTELNPDMSKAYQLAAAQYLEAGDHAKAGEVLTEGFTIAAKRGDRMPMTAMEGMLVKLGLPVPQVESKRAAELGPDSFVCSRTGRPGNRMARPPFRGPLGEWIQQHITKETFDDWIKQGTKVINELRLDLSREQDGETYDQHMREYLGIDEALYAQLASKN